MEAALELLTTSGGKSRNAAVQLALDTVQKETSTNGLPEDKILELLEIAKTAAEPVSKKLVRCLIPRDTVPVSAVMKALSWMCTNKPSIQLQALLMKWIVLVYDMVDDREKMHNLYGVVFYFLESDTLCPLVCHLLFLMTRKTDVKLFRVRVLLQLQQKMGVCPHIMGLLYVYKLYQPKMVALSVPRRCKSFFKTVDRVWENQIHQVQEKHQGEARNTQPSRSLGLRNRETSLTGPPAKRRKLDVIPPLQGVPFSQIESFSELLENLDKLELPNQMASVLREPLLQYLVIINPDPAVALRLEYWLDHVLYQEFFLAPDPSMKRGMELLRNIIRFSEFLQEGIPTCEYFLARYLRTWNGSDYRDLILKLVTRFRLHPYAVLKEVILQPLKKVFFSSNIYIKCQILVSLTSMLRNYLMVEWPRYKYTLRWQQEQEEDHSSSYESTPTHTNLMSVFNGGEVEKFNATETLAQFIQYTDHMCEVALLLEDNNQMITHCVWDFFEVVAMGHSRYKLPFVELPSRGIIYPALFSSNAVVLNRFCSVIIRYRESFEQLRNLHNGGDDFDEDERAAHHSSVRSKINQLNIIILDMCDVLWRYRAFISQENKTIFSLFTKDHKEQIQSSSPNLHRSFAVHLHYALIGFVHAFLEKTQPDVTKVHPLAIKNHRDQLLKYFNQRNLSGIHDFIRLFIKKKP